MNYLNSGALIRVGTFEKGHHDVRQGIGDVIPKGTAAMKTAIGHNLHILDETLVKELPHVFGRVDFFDLSLGVNVTMHQEVDVGILDLQLK